MQPEPQDPRIAMVLLTKEHLGYKPMQDIARWLVSDQSGLFMDAVLSSKGGWNYSGSLVQAVLAGYRSLRMLCKTSEVLYQTPDVDRIVALYLTLMISRAVDVTTNKQTQVEGLGSISTTAIINALAFGMCDLRAGEVQALTKWWASRTEMAREFEPFNHEWWIIAETMNWLFVASRKAA